MPMDQVTANFVDEVTTMVSHRRSDCDVDAYSDCFSMGRYSMEVVVEVPEEKNKRFVRLIGLPSCSFTRESNSMSVPFECGDVERKRAFGPARSDEV